MYRIVTLGPMGTHGHDAALHAQKILAKRGVKVSEGIGFNRKIIETMRQVIHAEDDFFGVIPVETGTEGFVREVIAGYLQLRKFFPDGPKLYIVGEISLQLHHNLLVRPMVASLDEIEGVISHPRVLAECLGRLEAINIPISSQVPAMSTADAADKVANNPAYAKFAAIGSNFAAEYYGLKVLKDEFEDSSKSEARFHIVGKKYPEPTGADRSAFIFRLPRKPGVFLDAVKVFEENRLTFSSIYMIPTEHKEDQVFYIEVDCHIESKEGKSVWNRLNVDALDRLFLGSFPRNGK